MRQSDKGQNPMGWLSGPRKFSLLKPRCTSPTRPVILLGLKPQGLFLLRELSRAGFEVHAIESTKTPAFYSKYGYKYLVGDHGTLASILSELHSRFGPGTHCYISSGSLVDCVVEYIPQLYDMFEVYPRPLSSVAVLCNKMRTYAVAERLGIDCLDTFTLEHEDSALAFCSNGSRLIAKWNREFTGTGSVPKFKTAILDTSTDLSRLKASLSAEEQANLILQPFLETSQDHNVSHLGYYVEGLCVAGFLAQQLRQYPKGITSYLREYEGPGADVLIARAQTLFKELKYTGFGEAEFKFDGDFTTPYLLEVNPRTCGWSSVLKTKFRELRRIFASPTCAVPLEGRSSAVRWGNVGRDMRAIIHNSQNHKSPYRLFADFVSWAWPKPVDGFDLADMLPFLIQPVQVLLGRRGRAR